MKNKVIILVWNTDIYIIPVQNTDEVNALTYIDNCYYGAYYDDARSDALNRVEIALRNVYDKDGLIPERALDEMCDKKISSSAWYGKWAKYKVSSIPDLYNSPPEVVDLSDKTVLTIVKSGTVNNVVNSGKTI